MAVTALVVYNGVEGGIEKVSRFMMPVLLVLVVVIAGYSLTLKNTGADGVTRTGLQGFLYYITPNFEGLTVQRFLQILLDAMSQLFFSLIVSMGIKITYGPYVKKDVNLGKAGTFVDARFFITAIFATLTSCISILESIAANCVEIFHTERKRPFLCSASFISRRAPSLRWATACSILNCRFPTARSANCWTVWTTSATLS